MSSTLRKSLLIVENVGNRKWKLMAPLSYYSRKYKKLIIAPIGTVTDFASVPRIFWSIFPPDGRYTRAAIIHDFLCNARKNGQLPELTREDIDYILYEAMLDIGVPKQSAIFIYAGVSLYRVLFRVK